MKKDEFISVVKGNTHHSVHFNAIMAAADAYSEASNGAKPIVSGSLPTVDEAGIAAVVSGIAEGGA